MKLSNEKILNDAPRLNAISRKELPIKASYAIAKNLTKIEAELSVYNKERLKLIDKYAQKDEAEKVVADANGQIVIKPECKEDWNREIQELLAIENDVAIHKFKVSDLKDCDILSPSDLMLIDYMIED